MTGRQRAAVAVRRALAERGLHEYDLTRAEFRELVTKTDAEVNQGRAPGPTREQRRRLKQLEVKQPKATIATSNMGGDIQDGGTWS